MTKPAGWYRDPDGALQYWDGEAWADNSTPPAVEEPAPKKSRADWMVLVGLGAAVVDLRLKHGSGRDVVISTPSDVPVIIFSGVPSESAELERLRPRTRLIEKPYSLVLLVETLEEMLAESSSQNLHS